MKLVLIFDTLQKVKKENEDDSELPLITPNKGYGFYDFNIYNDVKICSYVILGEASWPTNAYHVNKVINYRLIQKQIHSLTIILQAFSKARKIMSQVPQNVLCILLPIALQVSSGRNV